MECETEPQKRFSAAFEAADLKSTAFQVFRLYHLETLAHTKSWRSEATVSAFAQAVNHHSRVVKEGSNLHVKIGGSYSVPLWAYRYPFKPFEPAKPAGTALRKTLTHLAMAGGSQIDVVRQSADAVRAVSYTHLTLPTILRV